MRNGSPDGTDEDLPFDRVDETPTPEQVVCGQVVIN